MAKLICSFAARNSLPATDAESNWRKICLQIIHYVNVSVCIRDQLYVSFGLPQTVQLRIIAESVKSRHTDCGAVSRKTQKCVRQRGLWQLVTKKIASENETIKPGDCVGKWQCSVNWMRTHSSRDCVLVHPPTNGSVNFHIQHIANIIFPFRAFHSITSKNWNIITFLLVMVVWISQKIFVRASNREIDCGPMTFEFFVHCSVRRVAHFYGTRLFNAKQLTTTEKLSSLPLLARMMDVLNCLMKIMIM